MSGISTRFLFSALIAIGSLSASVGRADSPSERARALGDNIDLSNVQEPDRDVEWGRAEAVVDARAEDVLAVLHDYSQYAGLFPYFEKSKVLSQRGHDAIVYLEAKVLHGAATLWSQVRMRAHAAGETQIVEARMMSGKGNIATLLARWELTPIEGGNRTHVAFQILVDPDLPIPSMAVSSELRRGAGKAMRALRRRVSERATVATRSTSTL